MVWFGMLYRDGQAPFMPCIALAVCFYSTASLVASLWPLAGSAAIFAAEEAGAVLQGRPPGSGERVSYWIFVGLAVLLGRVVQRQRMLTKALAQQTRSLESSLEETARLAVVLERTRIARELHDVVTHKVTTMVIQAGVEGRMLGEQTGSTRDVLATIEQTGRDTLVELRRLLGVLRRDDEREGRTPPPTLDDVDALVNDVRRAGLPVQLQVEGARVSLSAGVEVSAYRIVQEALTNCLRHAGAVHAQVAIHYRRRTLELEVSDDGHGPTEAVTAGHGLTGMRERAAMHGGTLQAGPGPHGGYAVRAELLLDQ
jgi:signal transduction histidine kinase